MVLFFVGVWGIVEYVRWENSTGLGGMFWGSILFSAGLARQPIYTQPIDTQPIDTQLTWMILSIGLFMALNGTTRFIIRGVTGRK